MRKSKFDRIIKEFVNSEPILEKILQEQVPNSPESVGETGINTPPSDDVVSYDADTTSELPSPEEVELTAEKRVQLVQAIIDALFVSKPSAQDPNISGLVNNKVDLSNVEEKERAVLNLINTLKMPASIQPTH